MEIQNSPCWAAAVAAWHFRYSVLFFDFALTVIFHSEQVTPLKFPKSLDFGDQPYRLKKVLVRAPMPWASWGSRRAPIGLLPCPVLSCTLQLSLHGHLQRWTARPQGCGFFSSSGTCTNEFGGGEAAQPSMLTVTQCVISGSYSTRVFSTLKFKSPRRQLRAWLQDDKYWNSEHYTTV